MGDKLTLDDIAAQAGVSRSTVSRVLNEREHVSPHTRRRVMDVVSQGIVADKSFDLTLEQKTVVDAPPAGERMTPRASPVVLTIAAASQAITPWGTAPRRRDRELRSFWHTEPWLASVVYGVSIRNASFIWEVVGSNPGAVAPKNTIKKVERILKQSDRGRGWKSLIVKTCIDIYTQDNGAFWEILRINDRPDSPVINLAHLDASMCQRTGDPEFPVIYLDRRGREHLLRYWQVKTLEEFPSPVETAFNLQYSAVSRALLAAEIIQSISVYKQEKVGGTFTKAVDIVSGVSQNDVDDAIALAKEQILNQGLYRYSLPVIITGIDPSNTLSHVHIDLASLPDNFSEDTSFKWYVAQLAAAFGVDYQEIAPLMTGNLGSSQQSEIQHLKTQGKGPALIMGLFEDTINDGLVPGLVEFRFKEQDLRTESEKAEARFTRAKARSMQLKSGELDAEASRTLAVLDGDLPEWLAKEVDKRAEELPEMPQEELGKEMGPNQIEGGIESQNEKMTAKDVKALRHKISLDPFKFLKTRAAVKASYGSPGGTVIMPLWAADDLLDIQSKVLSGSSVARMTPAHQFHITLVYAPIVEDVDFKAINYAVAKHIKRLMPITVKTGDIEVFGEGAVVLTVEENSHLREIQGIIETEFRVRSIAVSPYSMQEEWRPHITLGYSTTGFVDMPIMPSIELSANLVTFTRTSYEIESEIYADSMGMMK